MTSFLSRMYRRFVSPKSKSPRARHARPLQLEALEGRDMCAALTPVNYTMATPYSAAVSVEMTWDTNGNGRKDARDYTGSYSGAMIGRNHVLTAGHCLYDTNSSTAPRGFADWTTVRPGRTPNSSPFGAVEGVTMTVPRSWTQGEKVNDYGVLRLGGNVGDRTGWFGYWVAPTPTLKEGAMNILHYPGGTVSNGTQEYHSSGYAAQVYSDTINYRHSSLSTYPGSSGAPVYFAGVTMNGRHYSNVIVGIHVRGDLGRNGALNSATRITSSVEGIIKEALRQDGNTRRNASQTVYVFQSSTGNGQSFASLQSAELENGEFLVGQTAASEVPPLAAEPMLPTAFSFTTFEPVALPSTDNKVDVELWSKPVAHDSLFATADFGSDELVPSAAFDKLLDGGANDDLTTGHDDVFAEIDTVLNPMDSQLLAA